MTRLRRLPSKETNIDEIFFETDKSNETKVDVSGQVMETKVDVNHRRRSKETSVDDITGHSSSRSSLSSNKRNLGW